MSEKPSKVQRQRSPTYPYVDLREAVSHLGNLFKKERYSLVPIDIALKHMGYSSANGSSLRVIAALNSFGLINNEGTREDRKVGISDLGRTVLNERESGKRLLAMREAALKPEMHQWVWQRWKLDYNPLPSEDNIAYTLIREQEFTDDAAHSFTKEFIATYDYAELGNLLEVSSDNEIIVDERQDVSSSVSSSLVQTPQNVGDVRELSIPLTGRKVAVLRVPSSLNKKDFQLLTMWLSVMENAELYKDEDNEVEDYQ